MQFFKMVMAIAGKTEFITLKMDKLSKTDLFRMIHKKIIMNNTKIEKLRKLNSQNLLKIKRKSKGSEINQRQLKKESRT
jgi:hypothetical protein